jgi:hypothetical protein
MKMSSLSNMADSPMAVDSAGRQTLPARPAFLLLAVFLLVSQVLLAQSSNTVRLAPGTCPEIRDGDIVSYAFTPQSDLPSAVAGIRDVELQFAHEGTVRSAAGPEETFSLHSLSRHGDHEAPESPMVAASDGSIQFRFRANLRSTARGSFYLVAIAGDPITVRGYQGETPKVLNNPLRQHLCLQVAPSY